jgi:hypothetical protein
VISDVRAKRFASLNKDHSVNFVVGFTVLSNLPVDRARLVHVAQDHALANLAYSALPRLIMKSQEDFYSLRRLKSVQTLGYRPLET